MSVGIITSAAYINAEMSAELGQLPPAFLPAGNTRLFKYQAGLLRHFVPRVFLSLPESFCVPGYDARLLDSLGVQVIRIPDGLSLAESVMLAVIQSVERDEPVFILHGDTLFLDLEEFPPDRVSVHRKPHPYPWAVVDGECPLRIAPSRETNGSTPGIVSGMFSFSRSLALLKCLARAGKEFLPALNQYAGETPEFRAANGSGEWLDFGHLNTYYDSRRTLTTQREFNALSFERDVVCKTSLQDWKMHAEASWFESLPVSFKPYIPAYLGRTGGKTQGYRLAYEFLCPLSDLYVFGALPPATWRRILAACGRMLAMFRENRPPEIEPEWFEHLYSTKTERRFAQFAAANHFLPAAEWRLNGVALPSPACIVAEMAQFIGPASAEECGILHGDFCLSNILFDFRRDAVKLLDPRGYILPAVPALHGDTRYDAGKLHHSISGGYDFILAGYFNLSMDGERALTLDVSEAQRQSDIERLFLEIVCNDDMEKFQTAAAISVLLFLSMLTLHADDPKRQWALFANALRTYQRFFGGSA